MQKNLQFLNFIVFACDLSSRSLPAVLPLPLLLEAGQVLGFKTFGLKVMPSLCMHLHDI